MKIIVASGVESRPPGGRAAHRDGNAHRAILKSDRQHGRAGRIGAFKKSDPLLAKIDLHDPSAKEILSEQAVDSSRRARIDLPEIENEQITNERNVSNPRSESMNPTRISPALDSDYPRRRSQSEPQLARSVQVQSAQAGARIEHEAKRPASRGHFNVQTDQPVAPFEGNLCERLPRSRQRQKERRERKQEKTRKHAGIVQRIRRNFNSLGRRAVGCWNRGSRAQGAHRAGRCGVEDGRLLRVERCFCLRAVKT